MFSDFPPIHPAIVHFPVALFLLSGLLGLISLFVKREFWKDLTLKSLIGGIIFSPIAVVTGMIEEQNLKHNESVHEILQIHKYCGLTILFFFQILIVWYWLRRLLMGNKEYILWVICLLLGTVLVLFQGYLGGEMVFERGAGVKPLEETMQGKSEHEHGSGEDGNEDMRDMKGMKEDSMKNMEDGDMKGMENMKNGDDMKGMNNKKDMNMPGMDMKSPMDTFKFKDNNPAWQKAKKERKNNK